MSHVLVAYGTKHGATADIAEAVAGQLRQEGHAVDCMPAREVVGLDSYDAAIVGSAVYMKRWRPEARRLLRRQAKALAERPFWLFSSGPFGETPDPTWSEPPHLIKEAERLGVRGHVVFGGRLPLEPSNFMERSMVKSCPPDKRDLRDWDAIRAWAKRIGAELSSGASGRVESSGPIAAA
jgi:menaquinone-dependent protoporphyrinogen oxidase